MDCKTAHLLLDFARPTPTELEASEAEALENHLLDCAACARLARDERRLDEHFGQAIRGVPIPTGLRERLLNGLKPEPAPLPRRRFARAAWSLAAAAALLLAVWGGSYLSRPRTLDVTQLQKNSYGQFMNRSRSQVDEWLEAGKFRTPSPDDFDYSRLTQYEVVQLQSKSVPMLLFTFPQQGEMKQARVYLLDGRQFNLNALKDASAYDSSCSVEFVAHPSDARYGYLVVHNADKVAAFYESTHHFTAAPN